MNSKKLFFPNIIIININIILIILITQAKAWVTLMKEADDGMHEGEKKITAITAETIDRRGSVE